MKQKAGLLLGLVFGVAGTTLGLYFAWVGFSSTPYGGRELGFFCGAMGVLVGGIWACIGTASGCWQKHVAAVAPSRTA
ncbi:hypothetical protein [Dyella sp. A6]|uniref:hypothetical protein n=1 Tax=Dyella aluminiiresistens TaxID=3069105 RepID=UPI002E7A70F4|nr:hypothetical protein [Dyella sp. A6]